jgi:hypothetical protein
MPMLRLCRSEKDDEAAALVTRCVMIQALSRSETVLA